LKKKKDLKGIIDQIPALLEEFTGYYHSKGYDNMLMIDVKN
jgi:hypothetical protein